MYTHTKGFTLIEILLALAIIAIGLTALLKATAENIANTHRIKEKSIMHWVAMQAVTMMQLRTITVTPASTQATKLLNTTIYWRVIIKPTPFQSVEQMTFFLSPKQTGPFTEEVNAFRYNYG